MHPIITKEIIEQYPERFQPDLTWAMANGVARTFDRFEPLQGMVEYLDQNQTPIRDFLEIGVYFGLGSLLLSNYVEAGGTVTGCDCLDFKDFTPQQIDAHRHHIRRVYNHIGHIRQVTTKFHEVASLDYLRVTDRQFDLIHVDANHMLEPFIRDTILAYNRLRPNGILLLDDVRGMDNPVSVLGSALGWRLIRDRVSVKPFVNGRYGIVRRTPENDEFFKSLFEMAAVVRPY